MSQPAAVEGYLYDELGRSSQVPVSPTLLVRQHFLDIKPPLHIPDQLFEYVEQEEIAEMYVLGLMEVPAPPVGMALSLPSPFPNSGMSNEHLIGKSRLSLPPSHTREVVQIIFLGLSSRKDLIAYGPSLPAYDTLPIGQPREVFNWLRLRAVLSPPIGVEGMGRKGRNPA